MAGRDASSGHIALVFKVRLLSGFQMLGSGPQPAGHGAPVWLLNALEDLPVKPVRRVTSPDWLQITGLVTGLYCQPCSTVTELETVSAPGGSFHAQVSYRLDSSSCSSSVVTFK